MSAKGFMLICNGFFINELVVANDQRIAAICISVKITLPHWSTNIDIIQSRTWIRHQNRKQRYVLRGCSIFNQIFTIMVLFVFAVVVLYIRSWSIWFGYPYLSGSLMWYFWDISETIWYSQPCITFIWNWNSHLKWSKQMLPESVPEYLFVMKPIATTIIIMVLVQNDEAVRFLSLWLLLLFCYHH